MDDRGRRDHHAPELRHREVARTLLDAGRAYGVFGAVFVFWEQIISRT